MSTYMGVPPRFKGVRLTEGERWPRTSGTNPKLATAVRKSDV